MLLGRAFWNFGWALTTDPKTKAIWTSCRTLGMAADFKGRKDYSLEVNGGMYEKRNVIQKSNQGQ
jgi:hypothetical protein